MRKLWIVMPALAAGCGAQMVRSASNSNSPYAPVNERERGGVIKYMSDGASFVVNRRRDDAYKQMYKSCDGPYRIIAEGQRVEGSSVVASGTSTGEATASTTGSTTTVSGKTNSDGFATSSESHYWYIQYACVAAPADSTHAVKP